jgi:hypothetical protein
MKLLPIVGVSDDISSYDEPALHTHRPSRDSHSQLVSALGTARFISVNPLRIFNPLPTEPFSAIC